MTEEMKQGAQNYTEDQIQVLEGLEAVRKRPGMYIGSTGPKGLHHLVYEIVDNSIDEALAGFCTEITVDILPENVIRVSDNGRGIPVGIHPKEGISAATVVYTILHAGGKFGGGGYKVSGGLHGVGASVVNALSEWLKLTVKDGKHVYFQEFHRGSYDELLHVIGDTTETGTTVEFKADAEIFEETTEYDYEVLLKRLREQAFLNAGIRIVFSDKRNEAEPCTEVLHYEGGIRQFVEYLHQKRGLEALSEDVIYVSGMDGDSFAEVALQYNDSYNEMILSFANNIHTADGGTHEVGFKNALTKVINEYGKKFGLLKDGQKLLGVFLLGLALARGQGDAPPGPVPLWLSLLCAAAMSGGTALGGRRIIRRMGRDMVALDPCRALSTDLAGALSLWAATLLGLPVSTTHTRTAALLGAGSAGGGQTDWSVAGQVVLAWLLTFPCCALLGWATGRVFLGWLV